MPATWFQHAVEVQSRAVGRKQVRAKYYTHDAYILIIIKAQIHVIHINRR